VPGSVEGIREALAWAGLDYDYGDHQPVVRARTMFPETTFTGPVKGGPHHPYFQVRFQVGGSSVSELTVISVRASRPLPNIRQEAH